MAAEAAEREDDVGPTVTVVELRLGDERFAVGVEDVDSFVEVDAVTRVPRTGEAIDGVIDLRGEITAVIDPRVYLDVEDAAETDERRVLVLDGSKDAQKIGFRVDEVLAVEDYPESAVEAPGTLDELDTAGVRERAIRSIIRRPAEDADFEPVALLDTDAIIEQSREDLRERSVV